MKWLFKHIGGVLLGALIVSNHASTQEPKRSSLHPFDENRTIIDANQYPFSAIGRLNGAGIDRRSHCTATLITPDHILTAAHCLYFRARKRWFLPNELNFLAGYQRGGFIEHAKIAEIIAKGGYDPDVKKSTSDRSSDWAILKLTKALDIQPIPIMGIDETPAGGTFQQSGYHKQRPHVQTFNDNCRIVQRLKDIFLHDCMLAPGDSGSPILYEKDGSYRVVGLNTSSLRRTGENESLGLAIARDLFENVLKD